MSLVRRQTAKGINREARHNTWRAARGVAGLFLTLLGLGIVGGYAANEKASEFHAALEREFMPGRAHPYPGNPEDRLNADTAQLHDSTHFTPFDFQLTSSDDFPAPERENPAPAISSTLSLSAAVVVGGILLVRRRPEPDNPLDIDVATLEDYGHDARVADAVQASQRITAAGSATDGFWHTLEERLATTTRDVAARAIQARLENDLNVLHINVLRDLGEDPLQALTYPSAGYYQSTRTAT